MIYGLGDTYSIRIRALSVFGYFPYTILYYNKSNELRTEYIKGDYVDLMEMDYDWSMKINI